MLSRPKKKQKMTQNPQNDRLEALKVELQELKEIEQRIRIEMEDQRR